jgi:transposase-like protein
MRYSEEKIQSVLKLLGNGKETISNVSRQVNIPNTTIRWWADRENVAYKRADNVRPRKHDKAVIVDLIDGKMRTKEIAAKHGISQQTITNIRKRNGIKSYYREGNGHIAKELKDKMLEMLEDLDGQGYNGSEIAKIICKDIGQVSIDTVIKWKGLHLRGGRIGKLLKKWKRSKALDSYIKELECTLQEN